MDEEKIKEAFLKVKDDMLTLGNEIINLKQNFFYIKSLLNQINKEINSLKIQNLVKKPVKTTQTHIKETSTHSATSTHNSTVPYEIEGLKTPNLGTSIRNQGASTDRQTDTSTDRQTLQYIDYEGKQEKPITQQISEATEILDSLDDIKKRIRLKFKRMTNQEMLIFSTIYQLEEQNPSSTDYKNLALKLGLSQSSIRDYVQRIIDKGIPISKTKINNKKVLLAIPQNLRKIASLQTIVKLREI